MMSDQRVHFVNQIIKAVTEEFQIQHKKSTPYHPQANGPVEVFNTILENVLTKVCSTSHDDWNLKIPTTLWAYRTTCKRLTCQTPFKPVYGKEVMISMEYIVHSLCIAAITGMSDKGAIKDIVVQLV